MEQREFEKNKEIAFAEDILRQCQSKGLTVNEVQAVIKNLSFLTEKSIDIQLNKEPFIYQVGKSVSASI